MTRRTVWWAIPLLAIAISLFALPTLAQSQTTVTGAGAGVYPAGTTIKSSSLSALKGVTLTSLTFGMGVGLPGDGTANGTFESTLIGTSAKGQPRNIVVEGNATRGSGQAGSPHYADLLPLWAKGEYFPLAFSRVRVEQVTSHRLQLKPAPR